MAQTGRQQLFGGAREGFARLIDREREVLDMRLISWSPRALPADMRRWPE
jgi:hypothetical protein